MSGTGAQIPANNATIQEALDLANEIAFKATGGDGTPYFFGTGAFTGLNLEYIVVNADVVFTNLRDTDDLDILANLGIAGNTITKGMIIKARSGKSIAKITMASGSVTGPE